MRRAGDDVSHGTLEDSMSKDLARLDYLMLPSVILTRPSAVFAAKSAVTTSEVFNKYLLKAKNKHIFNTF